MTPHMIGWRVMRMMPRAGSSLFRSLSAPFCFGGQNGLRVLASPTESAWRAPGVRAKTGAAVFPAKPSRIVVGCAPEGGRDIAPRYIAQRPGESGKRQVLVENRP